MAFRRMKQAVDSLAEMSRKVIEGEAIAIIIGSVWRWQDIQPIRCKINSSYFIFYHCQPPPLNQFFLTFPFDPYLNMSSFPVSSSLQECPQWTPDHALDLLFHPDIIPVQVRRELHQDLHVRLPWIDTLSQTNDSRFVHWPEQITAVRTFQSSQSSPLLPTRVLPRTKRALTCSVLHLGQISPLSSLTSPQTRLLLSAVCLLSTSSWEASAALGILRILLLILKFRERSLVCESFRLWQVSASERDVTKRFWTAAIRIFASVFSQF